MLNDSELWCCGRVLRSKSIKRAIDLCVSVAGGVAVLPIMLPVAVAIRATSGAPVLFRQVRAGQNARPFVMIKFRTMKDVLECENQPTCEEQRLTRVGRFLRSTSLDELPELLNVLRGEMSLVGPRPLLMEYLERYTPEQARRHDVKPGITGWAQINGRNAISWEEKFKLDVWYVDNWSVWLDIKILARTVWKVIRRDGISSGAHATMPKFEGSPREEKGSA